jgi:hypothetical protein
MINSQHYYQKKNTPEPGGVPIKIYAYPAVNLLFIAFCVVCVQQFVCFVPVGSAQEFFVEKLYFLILVRFTFWHVGIFFYFLAANSFKSF